MIYVVHMNNVSYELKWMKRGLSETCYAFFKVLANPTRLAILETLREKPKNVTEIAETLKQEQSMISHNLEPLEQCRFVFSERREKQRFYSLNKETVEPLFRLFVYHSQKYCPTRGKCLTQRGMREMRKKQASGQLRVTHG
jgi:DNA-binding transcriptional ArsR family regulator